MNPEIGKLYINNCSFLCHDDKLWANDKFSPTITIPPQTIMLYLGESKTKWFGFDYHQFLVGDKKIHVFHLDLNVGDIELASL